MGSSGSGDTAPYHPNNLLNRGIDGEYFVGRENDLDQIHDLLESVEPPNIVVVVGMPGVGKTELAIQYGRSHLISYPGGVAWFAAANFGEALQDWLQAEFCIDRDLRALATQKQRLAVGWKAWSQFCGSRPALVLVDDVTDYRQQVEPYLPQNLGDDSPFRFLLTSRLRLISPTPIPTKEVTELDLDAAIALLTRLAGPERIESDRATAESLCHRLANLPLALTLVGCWLSLDRDRTLAELIASLEENGLDAPALERDPDMVRLTAERGVNAAFAVSWHQLESRSADAPQLARMLTLFAPVDISWELVTAVVDTYDQLNPTKPPAPQPENRPAATGWLAPLGRMGQQIWQWLQHLLGLQPAPRPVPLPPVPITDVTTARHILERLSLLQGVDRPTKRDRLHPLLREFFRQQWQPEHDGQGWRLAFAHTIGDRASFSRRMQNRMARQKAQACRHHDALT
ncbi:MAG: AAA family ATPase [Leptolyngbyaceae bacterium]|nr:AAA family ATPase [Leptolyngbyaceae bacterium]